MNQPKCQFEQLLTVHLSKRQLKRFFSSFTVNPDSGCWEWQGLLNNAGYGRFYIHPQTHAAHRIAYAAFVAPIPRGFGKDVPQIDHLCRKRACVNPAHLELVSAKINVHRSQSAAAKNARKIRCVRGHLLAGDNLYTARDGKRSCRTCNRNGARARERQERRAAGCKVRNSERTHCPKGHPYGGENLRIKRNGKRDCRACDRERHRRNKINTHLSQEVL